MDKEYASYMSQKKKKTESSDTAKSYSEYVSQNRDKIDQKIEANKKYSSTYTDSSSSKGETHRDSGRKAPSATAAMDFAPKPITINSDVEEYRKRTFDNYQTQQRKTAERDTAIRNKYTTLDDNTMKEISLVSQGQEADKMTTGLTGVVTGLGSMTSKSNAYSDAIMMVDSGNRAYDRLKNEGYSDAEIKKWAEMYSQQESEKFNQALQEDAEALANEHPVLASAGTVALNMASAPLAAASIIDDTARGKIDTNSLALAPTQASRHIRSTISDNIAEDSEVGAWLYNVGMSGADSLAASAIPGGVALLATNAAVDTTIELTNRGLDADKALVGGLVAGAAEVIFESISIGKFKKLQEVSPMGVKDVVTNIAKSMGVNFSEEAVTEAANILYDTFANGDLSNYNIMVENYVAQGMTETQAKTEAKKQLLAQVFEAGAAGAVMGGAFGVIGSVGGYTKNTSQAKALGKAIQQSGSADAIIAEASAAPKKSRPNLAAEWAQKKLDKGKNADRALGVTAMESSQYIAQNDAVPVGEFQLATSLEEAQEMYADKKRMYEKASMTKAERSKALSQLDKDYRATVKSFTQYEKSGVSAMREAQADSILESAFKASKSNVSSPEEVAKAVSPTVGTTEDGKVVSVAEIEDISDGEVTVKTTEGESQVLDIEELKGDAKTLWEYASSHFADAKVADAFIKSYSGQNVETYSRVYKAVFDLAATGMSANQIRKEGLFDLSELGESAFESAVKSGAEAMSFRVGVVDLTTRPKTMSQKTVMAVAEEFAKRHSLNVTFVDTLGTKEGFYKKGSNQIVVALDSSKGAIGRTLGHEVYHYITEMSPEHASEIESFVVDTMTRLKGKKWVEGRYKFYEKQGYKTREAQIEEFVADQLFDAFSNENAVREFVKEDVSLAEQILNHIHDIIQEIKGIFKKLVGTGHYSDISAWQGDLDALDELNKMVLRVLADIESSKNGATQKAESIQETVEESAEEIVEDEIADEVAEEVTTEETEFDEYVEEDDFGGFEDENAPRYYELSQEEQDEWDAAVFGLTVEELRAIRSEAQRERALESEREWSRIWSTEEMDEDDLAFSSKRGYEESVARAMGKDSKVTRNNSGDITLVSNEDSSVFAYSEVTWNNGGRADLEKALKRNGYSADEVADTIESVDKVLGFLKNLSVDISDNKGYKKLAQHLAADITMDVVNGRQVLHSIVNNGDYPVNIDLALICKKRVAYMQVMKDLIDNGIMEQVKYDGVAIAKINEILRKNGFETACLGCFVESRRLQFQAWAETIVQEWNNAVDVALDGAKAESFNYSKLSKESSSLTAKEMDALERELASAPKNAQGNINLGKGGVATKMGVLLKAVPTLRKHITVSDLLTPEGLLNLRKDNPNLFSLVKSRYGAASPKIVQDYNPYSGEVADLTFAKVADITHNGVKGGDSYIKAAQKALAKDKPRQPKKMKAAEYKSTEAYIEWYDKVQTLAMRNYLYDIGGARMQSFSDFMIENVFDYVQIVADLAANKFPMHTYTKEISMMRLFGMTGMRINGSLIAHIDKSMGKKYAGLMPVSEAEKGNAVIVKTEDGEFAIGFDDYSRYASTKGTTNESFIQSIGFKDIVALMLDKRYSPYVGNIAIGVSDVQIKAMLDSPLFRMVIPYHASGMLPQFAELVGVDMYNDYTDYQNTGVLQCYDLQGNPVERFKKNSGSEEVDENGETKSKNLPIDTSYPFNAELKRVTERLRASGKSVADAPRIVASEYIEWCGKMHPVYDGKKFIGYATFSPKFSNSPYGTDFTEHPNYYKLLEDFDLYDSVTEDYVEQGAVEMRFPSVDNRMSAEEVAEYRERLKTSGVFTDAEVDSYVKKADMTFEELITAEVNNRADYDNTQAPKYKSTLDEISRELTSTSARTERLKGYGEFTSLLTSKSAKDKTKLRGMLPLEGTYDVPSKLSFSTKRESSIPEETSEYILNTKEYQKIIDIIKKRYNMLSTESLTPKAIERFANRVLKKAQSSYDVGLLTERLTALFDYMSNAGGDIAWEDVMSITADIANDVLQESRRLDRSMSAKYKQTLDYLDSVQLYVDKALKTQIEDEYGSVDNYRRLLGNKVHITTKDKPNSRTKVKRDMVSFGDVWNHLSKDNPEVFDGESSGVERLSSLVSFVEMTKPQYINPYGMIAEESAYDFALTIYDEFFNNSNIRSETMKYNVEDEKLRDEYNEMIDSIRRGYLSRLNEVKRASKTKVEETVSLFRQKHEAYRKKRNETQAKQSLRKSIYRVSKALVDKLVKPTDTKYIPQELTRPLLEFSKIITDGGTFDYKKTNRLIEAFAKMERSNTIDGIDSVIDESILNELMALRDLLEDRTLVELSESELRRVRDIVNDFRHLVSTTNKMHAENIRETVSEMGDTFISEMADKKVDHKRFGTSFQRGLIKPAVFFDLLESPTMQRLYQNIRNGESEWYRTSAEVKTKIASLQEDYGYSEWKNKPITIKRKMNGQTLAFTMEEALSIYATSQREQGLQHLLADGFVRQEDEYKRIKKALKKDAKDAKKKGKKSSEETPKAIIEAMQGRAVRLTVEDISAIVDAVKKASDGRAIKYADGFVGYMSKDMAELGNETALKLKGRKIFGEDYYFPIVSDPNHLHFSAAKGIDARLKSMSMTQATVEKAKNAVVIGGFTDTAAKHCLDMAMYASFTLPLEDFTRVFNYDVGATETSDATGVRQEIERVYGSGANDYIKQLLSDINGGVVVRGSGIVNKLLSMAKRDAVIGSMSVAIQQPSAIGRALAYINPKYFVTGRYKKSTWEELKKYAPVAGIKEMGYFDMNIGQSALEWVTDKSTVDSVNMLDKVKNARDWTVDKLAVLPSFMDQVTWVKIWNAVKNETHALHKDMDVKSDEFLKLAGERFTYVIDRTQVYDSVFARSEYMRSKDSGVKQMLAFMNEPLTSLNMLYEAVVMKQESPKAKAKFVTRTIVSLLTASVLNSALKSIIQTMRDDDDETSPIEQYLANVVENILYEPLGWLPILGDVLDYLRTGFESQSMTDSTLRSFADSATIWFDENKSTYEKLKATFSAIGLATGLPVKNVWREFEAVKKSVVATIVGTENLWGDRIGVAEALAEVDWLYGDDGVRFTEADRKKFTEGGTNTTGKGIGFAIHNASEWEKFKLTEEYKQADQALVAYLDGDEEHLDKVMGNLLRKYGNQKDVNEALRAAVKEKYIAEEIDRSTAEDMLVEVVGHSSSDAYWKLEEWDGGTEWNKYDNFYSAIDSGKSLKSVIKEYNDKGVSNRTLAGRITAQYKDQYIELYKTDRQAASKLKTKLIEAYALLGYKRADNPKTLMLG